VLINGLFKRRFLRQQSKKLKKAFLFADLQLKDEVFKDSSLIFAAHLINQV